MDDSASESNRTAPVVSAYVLLRLLRYITISNPRSPIKQQHTWEGFLPRIPTRSMELLINEKDGSSL